MTNTVPDDVYDELFSRVGGWQMRWNVRASRPYMRYRKAASSILIDDARWDTLRQWHYTDGSAALYEYCADARTIRDLHKRFGNEPWVNASLEEFVQHDLILFLDGRYLSLALPENPNFELDESAPAAPQESYSEIATSNAGPLVSIA